MKSTHQQAIVPDPTIGCELIVMPTKVVMPTTGEKTLKASDLKKLNKSDKKNLYLYKNQEGNGFFFTDGMELYQLDEESVQAIEKADLFNQAKGKEKPVKCEDTLANSVVLGMTASEGHTNPTLQAFNDFLDLLDKEFKKHPNYSETRKIIEGLAFIKLNTPFIRYAIGNWNAGNTAVFPMWDPHKKKDPGIYQNHEDRGKGVLRTHNGLSFHAISSELVNSKLSKNNPDRIEKELKSNCIQPVLENEAALIHMVDFYKEHPNQGKQLINEFLNKINIVEEGCLNARMAGASFHVSIHKNAYEIEGYELALMSSLNNNLGNAKDGIVYLADDGKGDYFVKGMKQKANLGTDKIKLSPLNNQKLNDSELKREILEVTSKRGHTKRKPPVIKLNDLYQDFQANYLKDSKGDLDLYKRLYSYFYPRIGEFMEIGGVQVQLTWENMLKYYSETMLWENNTDDEMKLKLEAFKKMLLFDVYENAGKVQAYSQYYVRINTFLILKVKKLQTKLYQ